MRRAATKTRPCRSLANSTSPPPRDPQDRPLYQLSHIFATTADSPALQPLRMHPSTLCSGLNNSAGLADRDSLRQEMLAHVRSGFSPMRKLVTTLVIVLGWALAAGAAPSAPLTSLRAIHALGNSEAGAHFPVDFEATVTYYRNSDRTLFVQDGDAAIYLFTTRNLKLVPGDRLRVRGITQPSFRPIVETNDITVLEHGDLPKPIPATYEELVHIQHDAMLVSVSAVVRSADVVLSNNGRLAYLHMLADGGTVDASIQSGDGAGLKELLDAEVVVTGVDSAGCADAEIEARP